MKTIEKLYKMYIPVSQKILGIMIAPVVPLENGNKEIVLR